MAFSEWIRPPRRALLLLVGVTGMLCSVLAALAWRLRAQDRALEGQQLRGRLENAADQLATTLDDSVAPADGIAAVMSGVTMQIHGLRLPWYPVPEPARPMPGTFARADSLEFRTRDLAQAATLLHAMTRSTDASVRSGAMLRLARVTRKAGRPDSAIAIYRAMTRDAGTIDALPASLMASDALVDALATSGDDAAAMAAADSAYAALVGGRWALGSGAFAFYADRLGGRLPSARRAAIDSAESPRLAIAAAADSLWQAWRQSDATRPFSGTRSLVVGEQPVLMAWRGTGAHAVARIRSAAAELAAARGELAGRRRLALLGLAIAALIVVIGVFAVARAVHREIEVARLKSDFVSAVSHEFRTPLTTMRQLTELLASGRVASDERRTTYYATLQREGDRLHRLVEELLDFGRMEAGALEFRPEPLDASTVVLDVVREFQAEVADRGYQVAFRSDDGHDFGIHADREAIGRAVWNLLDNAVKYSPDDRTVSVHVGRDNGTVAIRVRDRGAGIPAGEQGRIFEKFVRGTASELRGVKGTGIGLAMVRHIAVAHGGAVSVTSAPGDGSTFTLQLPAAP